MSFTTLRLHHQLIAGERAGSPLEVVRRLVAVQAQDYLAAKWALGLRTSGTTDGEVEAVFNGGTILRTHLLRPTWHFVLAEDIGWLAALNAQRLKAALSTPGRQVGLDGDHFRRANDLLERTLGGRQQRTRLELKAHFEQAGLLAPSDIPQRCELLLQHAELD
jgi:hypothetical protein